MKKIIMLATVALISNTLVYGAGPQTAPAQNAQPNAWSRAVNSPDPIHKNGFISDSDISKNFYDALKNDRILSSDTKQNVEIRVYNGKATLQGKVKDNKERKIVNDIAKRIPGIENVKSNLSTRS